MHIVHGAPSFHLATPELDLSVTIHCGQTESPWNGRHIGRLGIEEVDSYFAKGVEVSRQDLLATEGGPTTRRFRRDEGISLKTIQAVAAVRPDFGAISKILPSGDDAVTLINDSGASTTVPIDRKFLSPGHPCYPSSP